MWQLSEHQYFELENKKGISKVLSEYSNSVNNIFLKIDNELKKIMTDF